MELFTSLDATSIPIIIALAAIVGSAVYNMYKSRQRNAFDFSKVMIIIEDAINSLVELNRINIDSEGIVKIIATQVKSMIDTSDLTQLEKDYWTIERLQVIITGVLRLTVKAEALGAKLYVKK